MTAKLQIAPGQRFGKLVAIAAAPRSAARRHRMFQFKCDCGNEVVRAVAEVKRGLVSVAVLDATLALPATLES